MKNKADVQTWAKYKWTKTAGQPIAFWVMDDCNREVVTWRGSWSGIHGGVTSGKNVSSSGVDGDTAKVKRSVIFALNPARDIDFDNLDQAYRNDPEVVSPKKLHIGDEQVMDADSWKRVSTFRARHPAARNILFSKNWLYIENSQRWFSQEETFAWIDLIADLVRTANNEPLSGIDHDAVISRCAQAATKPWWKKSARTGAS